MGLSRRSVRCFFLITNSFLCFGAYYIDDSVISLQPFLIGAPCDGNVSDSAANNCCVSCLGFSPLEYNVIVGLPTAVSTIAGLIAGMIVDRFGYCRVMIISTVLIILGASVRAVGSRAGTSHSLSFALLLCGGLLVENSFAIIFMIQLYVCAHWFSGRYLGFVIGFSLAVAFSGSVLVYYINPILIDAIGLENTLWCAIPFGGTSLLSAILLSAGEKMAEGKDYGSVEQKDPSSGSLATFCALGTRFWIVNLIIATSWLLFYAFIGNSVAYQTDIFRLHYEFASFSTGVMYIIKIVFSPIAGVIASHFDIHGPVGLIGCLCYVSAMTMLSLAIGPPIVIIILMGLGFAIVYTVLAAIIPQLVSFDKLCTANGIMNAFMALAIGGGDIAVGAIAESHSDRVQGWLQSGVFLLALAVVETVLMILVLVMDALSANRVMCCSRQQYEQFD